MTQPITLQGRNITVSSMRKLLGSSLSKLNGGSFVSFSIVVQPSRDPADDGPEVEIIRRYKRR